MRRIILHRCRHWTFLKPTLNILQKTKVETSPCNSLLSSFRVFTTPNHSDYSRKDPMNPTFSSLRTVAGDAVMNWVFFSPVRDPLLCIVHQTFLWPCFLSSAHPFLLLHLRKFLQHPKLVHRESAQQQNIHKRPSNQHSWTAQPMLGHPTFHSFFTHLTTRH